MVIANPIYDVVFKRLMENERVAKFFIGTLLGETIENIEVKPQEYTYEGEFHDDDPKKYEIIEERIKKRYTIWVYRLDFIATIRLKSGEQKKVLIEIQKARNYVDLMRFRNYLAEHYKKEDTIDKIKTILPITTIYILGFNLPEIDSPCLKVERNYKDLINNKIIDRKSDFVEKLTHDSFIVQVEKITNRYSTKLDKLLSIFAQQHFIGDDKIIKEFKHDLDNEDVKIATDILHYSGTNPVERKKIEIEQEAWRTITALFGETKNELLKVIDEKERVIDKKERIIDEKDRVIDEKEKVIDEKERVIDEKEKEINEKDRLIAELLKKIDENK